MKKQLY